MKKRSLLALLLVAVLLLSGCALVKKDEAVDAKRIIVQVGSDTVDKATFNNFVTYYLQQQKANYDQQDAYYQQMYGFPLYNFDVTDKDNIDKARDAALDMYVENFVKKQKAAALGLDTLTDEELADIKVSAEKEYADIKESIVTYYGIDTTAVDEAELATQLDTMASLMGYSVESFESAAKTEATEEKLKNSVVKDIAVTREEVESDFESKVAAAKTSYEGNLSAYGAALLNGETTYYAPAGYRNVRQILVKLAQADSDAITAKQSEITTANTLLTSAASTLTSYEEADTQGYSEEELAAHQTALDEAKTAKDEAQAKLDALNAELTALQDTAYAACKVRADEVYAKINAGEDFTALIAQYNEDTGMPENGYAVCEGFTSFDEAFVTAAMGIPAVGGVAEPAKGSYGYYIIRYDGDVKEGAVDIETVAQSLSDALLTTKQDNAYADAVAQWVNDAKSVTKTYKSRLLD